MNPILNQNLFFIKEHIGMFKAANNYDIFDPSNNQMILTCREENLGFFTKMFRFSKYKKMTPFNIVIKTTAGEKVLTVKKGTSFILSKVEVLDENGTFVGFFKQKFFSIGGKFDVMDASGNPFCTLKGKWTTWEYKFVKDNVEFATITKKWAGLGKELFTSADNYMLQIHQDVPANHPMRNLIFAAVMCIDMVFHE